MGYVIMQLAVSLDGYIAKKDGSVDFLGEMKGEITKDFQSFVDGIDTIVMGYGSYQKMLEFGEIPFQDKEVLILTSKKLSSSASHVSFTNKSIRDIVEKAKGTIWLFGGAKIIQSFINEDLVDEMQLLVVNKVIGEGIPLFLENKGIRELKLVTTKQYDDNVMLVYKRNKKSV